MLTTIAIKLSGPLMIAPDPGPVVGAVDSRFSRTLVPSLLGDDPSWMDWESISFEKGDDNGSR
jgi:hypothetical protein